MATFAPLRPGDPQRLGGLDLLGRLGEGGQGVVYLAKGPDDSRVAVKWLRPDLSGDQVSAERFMREVEVAQQVAPFCTAAVLGTGVEQDRPYIVSEFIEGPSLHRVVQEDGPRTGTVLHRLAIGTATALAAIHQAGIVHRDFKPANVIIGVDGPRVIDFGIARALNATSTISSMVVGTPAYMSPEQIMGHTVGPAADMFSWASAMVFAASGQAPFGSDTMPAVINRVLNQHPDLGMLDGQLRDVVAACLSKDPAQRPSAEQVIMQLLRHPAPGATPSSGPQPTPGSGILAQAAAEAAPAPSSPFASPSGPLGPHSGPVAPRPGPHPGPYSGPPSGPMPGPPPGPASGPGPYPGPGGHSGPIPHTGSVAPSPQPPWQPPGPYSQPTHPSWADQRPPKKSRAPLVAGITVAVALLILAGVVVYVQADKATMAGPVNTPAPTSRQTRAAAPTGQAVPRPGIKKALPGAKISLYEDPGDAIVLTSYEIYDKKKDDWIDYARGSLRGSFTKYAANWESRVSPDGRYLAERGSKYSSDDFDFIVLTDRQTGDRSTIKTVKEPLISSIRAWSRDGSKILLNTQRKVGSKWLYLGFVIVDVAGKKATQVDVSDTSVRQTAFGFDGAEDGAVNVYGDEKNRSLRFYNALGKATHSANEIGTLSAGTQDIFSPSGKAFVTNCPNGGDGDHCIWDTRSGERLRKFSSQCDKVLGFYDETHLYCWEQDNGADDEIQVVDFTGKLVRKLLEVPDDIDFSPVFTVNPNKRS
ncbi:protein kinase [Nonomuraea angiospora]|uniref:Serine/threonine protein kinase n=1 Tax=Nonomuraea angiospora TaxID=46172 RepID=A0ABR9MAS9_9ACTN|nr:protein kinase [Nonomuraea angiospora]MBE1590019.1 serine/threonine protein kinase [Nonomuraea angiospora]